MRPVAACAFLVFVSFSAAACAPDAPGPEDGEGLSAASADRPGVAADTRAAALFRKGVTFQTFLAGVERRVETWEANYRRGEVDAALLAEAREIPGAWRLLVVAEDWCGDSANTLPYVARLDDALDNLDVRVVDSRTGRGVMEAHPTPDGRAATPTMVLLGPDGGEAGCLVEQPRPLQEWWLGDARAITDEDARLAEKYAWYDRDAGASVTREVVEIMRRASEGKPLCRAPVPGG